MSCHCHLTPIFYFYFLTTTESKFKDFEDGVQYFCAKDIEADLIITNNKKDFVESEIFALKADEFFALYMDD